jgi:iron complex transport system ATP-binding protein
VTSTLAADTALACVDLNVNLGGAEILIGVDLQIPVGQWATVIGPNGAGKTTLLRCLAGLLAHDGDVVLDGGAIARLSTRQRARRIAMVPQTPEIPVGMAVFDYVMMGRTSHQGFGLGASADDHDAVGAVLARLDLRGFARRRLDSLSGGELQRAVIARALAQDASIVLFDEPTSALDIGHQLEVLELIEELRQERGLTVVSTLHDLSLAGQFAERIVMLSSGRVVADGSPQQVLTEETLARYYGAAVEVSSDHRGVAIIVRRKGPPK